MQKLFLLCFLTALLFSCKEKGDGGQASDDSIPRTTTNEENDQLDNQKWQTDSATIWGSAYRVQDNQEAYDLIKHFRTADLKIKRDKPDNDHDKDDKKNIRVVFDNEPIELAFKNKTVIEILAITAGYPNTVTNTAKKGKATILLRLVLKSPNKSTNDTLFYYPMKEQLCPLPEPCP